MFSFIRRHWIAYIILMVLAIVLGLGAAAILGVKWSTPADVRSEHIKAERSNSKSADTLANEISSGAQQLDATQSSSAETDSAAGTSADTGSSSTGSTGTGQGSSAATGSSSQ